MATQSRIAQVHRQSVPGQIVLVGQGGGALGSYQAGVYQALHEATLEPDWVIGTSIGAINGAIIAGNRPVNRLERLQRFWDQVDHHLYADAAGALPVIGEALADLSTVTAGIPSFFAPNPWAWWGVYVPVGVEHAAFYSAAPLRTTLADLVDFGHINDKATRLTVGAVNVRSGEMRYFDSSREPLGPDHVMASAALPPAFPAVRIEGELFWDGGLYSNTPIEVVFEEVPRRNSVVFAVSLWQPSGPEPQSIWQVLGRRKDIQLASHVNSHLSSQRQMHRLRRVIGELGKAIPTGERDTPHVKTLLSYGCQTTMHVCRLVVPPLEGENPAKDISFSPNAVQGRWQAGYEDAIRMIERAPWTTESDPIDGVIFHDLD
ncbi:membrane protein [Pandoraea terrae]|uniref:Membrane protein n=1 Tax=Pandoraea terrae TaxID=1537710 RepID=A0A5E4S2K5_9BURK|nr:patatin-like phospholipase family protein [Pandoraea terrae]VVD68922.1 membrane protein [Pandoraea terrae]